MKNLKMGDSCVQSRDDHLGQLMLEKLRQHGDTICQIDAATGDEETYASVASRSIRLARALREFGLRPGDVLALGGRNHLDLHIPFYAALYNGLPIVGVDPFYKYDEVRTIFKLTEPKVAFCDSESCDTYSRAAADLGLDMKIVTFGHGECTMAQFIDKYDTEEHEEDFRVTDFNTDKIFAFLVSTSGTNGQVKVVAFNHKPFILKIKGLLKLYNDDKQPKKKVLNLSPVNWISNYYMAISGPIVGDTKVQSSIPDNNDHVIYMINKYKPVTCIMGPAMVTYLVSRKEDVDFSCFKSVTITGSKIFPELLAKFKSLLGEDTLAVEAYGQTETIGSVLGPIPDGPSGSRGRPLPIYEKKLLSDKCIVIEAYGQTEMIGPVISPNPLGPPGNCGHPMDMYSVKLVDSDTGVEINEPNVTGEIYVKGPGFSEYYNDPEETANSFTKDGYYKTGDLLYRDKDNNYFFVDRIKTLIKYRGTSIYPAEIEEVIYRLPGVKEVCVVGIDDRETNQKPAACVVRHQGSDVTAQEIKDFVANNLSKNKELRGGVLFLDSLPHTSSGKIHRVKVKEIATNAKRE